MSVNKPLQLVGSEPGVPRRGFDPHLHGARGLFALMIFAFHVVNSGLPTYPILSSGIGLFASRSLEHGVELFFGISGIVMVGALRRAPSAAVFAIDRATRIYPVLWASVALLVIAAATTGYQSRHLPSLIVLASNLLALPPLVPGPLIHPAAWSISYEMAFYLLCAVSWKFHARLGVWTALIIAPVAAWLLATHIRAVLMPVGMLAAVWATRANSRPFWTAAPGLALLAFLGVWEFACEAVGGSLMEAPLSRVFEGPPLFAIALGVCSGAALFTGLLTGKGGLCSVLRRPAVQFLGTVSYSFYLWHPLIMSVTKSMMYHLHAERYLGSSSQLCFFAFALPPALFVSWLSAETLERRVTPWLRRRLEGRFAKTRDVTPVTVDPSGLPPVGTVKPS